jgi:hypothetical protein
MNRREFLKLIAIASPAILFISGFRGKVFNQPSQVQVGDQLVRGTSDGKILTSDDYGKTWKLHTRFDPDVSIVDMKADFSGNIYARMEYMRHSFQLKLTQNGRHWVTV